jgi:hypothetical protein
MARPKKNQEVTPVAAVAELSKAAIIAAELADVRYQIDLLTGRKEELMTALLVEIDEKPCTIDDKYRVTLVERTTVAYKDMVERLLPGVDKAPYSKKSPSWQFKVLK